MKQIFHALLWLFIASSSLTGLVAKDLSNDKVITMSQSGIAEETLLLLINQEQGRFDLSPEALIDLQKKGITTPVINAMILANNRSSPPPLAETTVPAPKIQEPAPDKAANTTWPVVLVDGEEFNDLPACAGATRLSLSGAFGLSSNHVTVIPRAQSAFRTKNRNPHFVVRASSILNPADVAVLVRLDQRGDNREVLVSDQGVVAKKYIIPMKIPKGPKKLASDAPAIEKVMSILSSAWEFSLRAPLPPGEYAIHVGLSFYEFAID